MKGNIILVDDDKNLRYSINLGLKIFGYHIVGFETPIEALEFLKKDNNINIYDLIITDIQMPKMNGIKFIEELNKIESNIPVLVMTGYGTKDMVIELMRLGCNDFIDKPFDNKFLLHTIEKLIKKRDIEINKKVYDAEKIEQKNIIEHYNKNLNSAKETYRNIVKIDNESFAHIFQYKQKFFMELGGDFLDIHKNNNFIDVIISDVSGHDFGASYQNIIIKSTFVELIDGLIERNNFIERLNRNLLLNNKQERMATAIYYYYNIKEKQIHLFNAGHPYPILILNGKISYIENNGDMLGILDEIKTEEIVFDVNSKDRIIVFTDGILDIYKYNKQNHKKEKFSLNTLNKIIEKNLEKDIETFTEIIYNEILEYGNNKIVDDTLLTVFEIP